MNRNPSKRIVSLNGLLESITKIKLRGRCLPETNTLSYHSLKKKLEDKSFFYLAMTTFFEVDLFYGQAINISILAKIVIRGTLKTHF
jgi:hypothetical protein